MNNGNYRSRDHGKRVGLRSHVAEAEPLLLKGYEGMKAHKKTIPPTGSTRIPEALDRLIELYTAINNPDLVKKYKTLIVNYQTPKEVTPMLKEKK